MFPYANLLLVASVTTPPLCCVVGVATVSLQTTRLATLHSKLFRHPAAVVNYHFYGPSGPI